MLTDEELAYFIFMSEQEKKDEEEASEETEVRVLPQSS